MKWRRPLATGDRSVNSRDSTPQSTRRATVPSQAANANGSTQPVSAVLAPRIELTYSMTWSGSAPNWADPSPSPVRISSCRAIGSVVVVTATVVGIWACEVGVLVSIASPGGAIAIVVGGVVVVVTSNVRLGIGATLASVLPVIALHDASATAVSGIATSAIARRRRSERGPMTDIVPDILAGATSADRDHRESNNQPAWRPRSRPCSMYHSRPNAKANISGVMRVKKPASVTWLAWAEIASNLLVTKSETSTIIVSSA